MSRRPFRRVFREPLASDGLKAVCGAFDPPQFLDLPFDARINAVLEQFPRVVAPGTRVLQADFRIDPEREELLFPCKPEFEPPILLTGGRYQQKHPAPSNSFVGFRSGFAFLIAVSVRGILGVPSGKDEPSTP